MKPRRSARSTSVPFLLAQVGAHAAMRFAQQLGPLDLAPPHVGILRALQDSAGMSQRRLAGLLGLHASRLVALVDDLEARGLAERGASPGDRRSHALRITELGKQTFRNAMQIAAKHQEELCAALDAREREQLAGFLARIAQQQGLPAGPLT